MSFRDYQQEVDGWAKQFTPPYWPALERFARLAEEVGEVGRELNHIHGTKKKKPEEAQRNLGEELCDVLFTVCCIANSHGINLEEEWRTMMEQKHYGRDNQRFERKQL